MRRKNIGKLTGVESDDKTLDVDGEFPTLTEEILERSIKGCEKLREPARQCKLLNNNSYASRQLKAAVGLSSQNFYGGSKNLKKTFKLRNYEPLQVFQSNVCGIITKRGTSMSPASDKANSNCDRRIIQSSPSDRRFGSWDLNQSPKSLRKRINSVQTFVKGIEDKSPAARTTQVSPENKLQECQIKDDWLSKPSSPDSSKNRTYGRLTKKRKQPFENSTMSNSFDFDVNDSPRKYSSIKRDENSGGNSSCEEIHLSPSPEENQIRRNSEVERTDSGTEIITAADEDLSSNVYKEICNMDHGLPNLSSTCYMNSVLQCILRLQPHAVGFQKVLSIESLPEGTLIWQLQKIIERETPVISYLKKIMSFTTFSTKGQQDAQEFLGQIMEAMNEELNVHCSKEVVQQFLQTFEFYLLQKYICKSCRKVSQRKETLQMLSVDVPSDSEEIFSLQDAANNYFKVETIKAACEACNEKESDHDLINTCSSLPKVLMVHLKRYTLKDSAVAKLQNLVAVTPVLDLHQHIQQEANETLQIAMSPLKTIQNINLQCMSVSPTSPIRVPFKQIENSGSPQQLKKPITLKGGISTVEVVSAAKESSLSLPFRETSTEQDLGFDLDDKDAALPDLDTQDLTGMEVDVNFEDEERDMQTAVEESLKETEAHKKELELAAEEDNAGIPKSFEEQLKLATEMSLRDGPVEEEWADSDMELAKRQSLIDNSKMNNWPDEEDLDNLQKNEVEEAEEEDKSVDLVTGPHRYRLVGIVNHHGSSVVFGHYTADVFNQEQNCWYHYDDRNASPVKFSEVRNKSKRNGYLFFYVAQT